MFSPLCEAGLTQSILQMKKQAGALLVVGKSGRRPRSGSPRVFVANLSVKVFAADDF
jgi:hypothetical protein